MEFFYGRELLRSELTEKIQETTTRPLTELLQRPGFTEGDGRISCNRCGANRTGDRQTAPCDCGQACYYCIRCLEMGKIKRCSTLYYHPETNQFDSLPESVLTWKGTLSAQQEEASNDIVETIQKGETRLIWAVAGAGKTEMLFKGIEQALKTKKRICVASPRVDVCLELAPRLQSAFQSVPLTVLFGGAEEPYRYTQLVVATTHQLLRFREAFDVLIIDEIDAFPFHSDPTLHFAAKKARKSKGALLYLSATPDKKMQMAVRKKKLLATVLPARYHGYPLPHPRPIWGGDWRKDILQNRQKAVYLKYIQRLLENERRFLIFVPDIQLMIQLTDHLEKRFPEKSFTSVSSADALRKEKVASMRKEEYDFLLTTTILERGVTFRDIDVLVLGAEDRTFTEAALVQIAGRAGRHKDFPSGEVLFMHHGQTRAMKSAIRQIKNMNRLAAERGLLRV